MIYTLEELKAISSHITNNIDKMLTIYKKEEEKHPKHLIEHAYKQINYRLYRDAHLGTWSAYIVLNKNFFKFNIDGKEKIVKQPLAKLYKTYPELTYFTREDGKHNRYIGIVSTGLYPYEYQKQLTTIAEALYNNHNLKEDEIIDSLNRIEYVSANEVTNKVKEIIDFLYTECIPKELREIPEVICARCGKTITKSQPRVKSSLGNGKYVCKTCREHEKRDEYIPLDKLKKGKLYTKTRKKKKYYCCHICGLLTTKLFTHSTVVHNVEMDEYSKLFEIELSKYYKNNKDAERISRFNSRKHKREEQVINKIKEKLHIDSLEQLDVDNCIFILKDSEVTLEPNVTYYQDNEIIRTKIQDYNITVINNERGEK